MTYNVALPRISVRSPSTENPSSFELGQTAVDGEMCFWLSLGYTAEVSAWNGAHYALTQRYYPEDL